MSEGWIALHRGWRDNPIFRGEFSRADAWIWLIEAACWRATRYDIKGKTVVLARGQVCASREQMAAAWQWSPSAVERFLARLKTEQMIGRETGQGKSVITICNYNKYQDRAEQTGQESEQPTGQESDRDRTAKEQGNKGTRDVPSGTSSATARKIGRAIPADWKPILSPAAQGTVDGWPPGHFERVLAAFLDHAADKGRTSKDWQAAFRTWISNENKWNRPNGQPARQSLQPNAGRGERRNRCLDMVLAAEAEDDPAEGPQPDWQARPALRAIGQG